MESSSWREIFTITNSELVRGVTFTLPSSNNRTWYTKKLEVLHSKCTWVWLQSTFFQIFPQLWKALIGYANFMPKRFWIRRVAVEWSGTKDQPITRKVPNMDHFYDRVNCLLVGRMK
eukprot:scaffold9072_cov106-Cylindrotheca_fusiformis.AAC.2